MQYRFEHSRRAKTPDDVRGHLKEMQDKLGDVDVQIGVYAAFDGCAPPIRLKASRWDFLKDADLAPILNDHPTQTAQIVPLY